MKISSGQFKIQQLSDHPNSESSNIMQSQVNMTTTILSDIDSNTNIDRSKTNSSLMYSSDSDKDN